MKLKILHITDLHLRNFDKGSELLRKRFFQEYIDKLGEALLKDHTNKINYIVLSGDFVDKAIIANFSYVDEIISYLCLKFDITVNNVCCCIGNHDYEWKKEVADFSNSNELRDPFYKFIEKYNSNVITKTDRYFLKKLDDDVFFLSLDSTLRSKDGNPGEISDSEIDEIIVDVLKKNVGINATLLIGCHFPIISYENNFLASGEVNWHEKHVWIKAAALNDRVKNIETKNTIWFHGDVHAGDQKEIDNSSFILTGRFGGQLDQFSEFPRQAIVVDVVDDEQLVYVYNYKFDTHSANPHIGNWVSSGVKSIRTIQPVPKVDQDKTKKPAFSLKVIDPEIEEQIMNIIASSTLFKFGRFKTSEKHSSLGWINVNKLMGSATLLSRIAEKSVKYITEQVTCSNYKCVLIGLEVIGGILASQVSIRTNTNNYIFPIRGNNKFYSAEETNKTALFDKIGIIDEVVIFIDVISSGNTMSEFIDLLRSKKATLKVHVISVISNNIPTAITAVDAISSYGTFCYKLKIPLIANAELPDESIFESTLDFT